ncbi:MAG: hypothetical protein ABWZ40_07220 [Caulobacterales bacterium]
MFRAFALAAALSCACIVNAPDKAHAESAVTQPADFLSGSYDVKGEPFGGGNPYTGVVTVEKTGATYKVVWYPGPDQVEGVGVWWGGQFSVGYMQSGKQGVAVYVPAGNGLKGVWSELGETRIAPEDWVKR